MDSITKRPELTEIHTKSCVDCKTTRTPLWRSGPSGPRSLCNACGIRYRKKGRHVVIGLKKEKREKGKKKNVKKINTLLGEDEEAAFLLMDLSCRSDYP